VVELHNVIYVLVDPLHMYCVEHFTSKVSNDMQMATLAKRGLGSHNIHYISKACMQTRVVYAFLLTQRMVYMCMSAMSWSMQCSADTYADAARHLEAVGMVNAAVHGPRTRAIFISSSSEVGDGIGAHFGIIAIQFALYPYWFFMSVYTCLRLPIFLQLCPL